MLVTGATGLVGSHVVDNLLQKGFRVRAVARSKAKADAFCRVRPQYSSTLEFCFIEDLTDAGAFDEAVKDVDGVIHIASVSFIESRLGSHIADEDHRIQALQLWLRRQ